MEYSLLPSEASYAFLLVLSLVYYGKQQYKSHRTTCYKMFLVSSMIYQFLVVLSVCLIKYFDVNLFTKYIWRFQYIFMFTSWNFLMIYILIFMNKEEGNLLKVIKSDKNVIGIIVSIAVISIAFLLPFDYKLIDTVTKTNVVYYSPKMAIILLVSNLASVLLCMKKILENRHNLSKEFKFVNIISVLSIFIISIIHILYDNITFYPIVFALIGYTIYFSIENPDIIMMDEIQRLQKNEDNKNTDNFLSNVDEKILDLVNEIDYLAEQNLNDEKLIDESIERLQKIKKEGTALIEKMTEILDVSDYEVENQKNDDRRYETKELIKRIMIYTQEKLKDSKVKLMFNINPNISSKLYGDIEKICQSAENVINFSVENTRVGRITVSVSSTKVENLEELTIKIVDTGEGINNEDITSIFDEDKTKYRNLCIANKIVKLIEGKMWCESQFKIGTKTFIQVTQRIADANPIGDISKINEETIVNMKEIDYSKYKVLLVDDNMINNKLTKKILEEKRFNVEVVSSGEECIRKIKAEEEIDLIFMDIMMPVMDGVETLKVLKDLDGYILPPIVALTANALPGMKETYLSEGFDDYLAKPLSAKELENVLRLHLAKDKKEENVN